MTPRGTLIIVGGENAGSLLGMGRVLRAPFVSMFSSQRMRGLISLERAAIFDELRGLIESGAVIPRVDRAYPLEEAADAMRHLVEGHPAGKVALTVG